MKPRRALCSVLAAFVACAVPAAAGPTEEIESFDGGVFNNPFFSHTFDYDHPCCWEIVTPDRVEWILHLRPNTDTVEFGLTPDRIIIRIEVRLEDFEGGFTGVDPTSAVVIRGDTDFISLHCADLGVPEALIATNITPGQLEGNPLGALRSMQIQAANEGNAIVEGVGAFVYEMRITIVDAPCRADFDGDGFLTGLDFDAFVGAFESGDQRADFDRDGFITGLDFDAYVVAFEAGCD